MYFFVYTLAQLRNTALCVTLVVILMAVFIVFRVIEARRRGLRVEVRPDVVLVSRHRNESLKYMRSSTIFTFHHVLRDHPRSGTSLVLSATTSTGRTEIDCSGLGELIFTALEQRSRGIRWAEDDDAVDDVGGAAATVEGGGNVARGVPGECFGEPVEGGGVDQTEVL
ncbi:MAG: hypothetical protein ACRDJC_00950 [Thermomicrobiales bacterium]